MDSGGTSKVRHKWLNGGHAPGVEWLERQLITRNSSRNIQIFGSGISTKLTHSARRRHNININIFWTKYKLGICICWVTHTDSSSPAIIQTTSLGNFQFCSFACIEQHGVVVGQKNSESWSIVDNCLVFTMTLIIPIYIQCFVNIITECVAILYVGLGVFLFYKNSETMINQSVGKVCNKKDDIGKQLLEKNNSFSDHNWSINNCTMRVLSHYYNKFRLIGS